MAWYVGVDVGSFTCKVALIGEDGPVDALVVPSRTDYARSAREALAGLLEANEISVDEVQSTVATGVGARRMELAGTAVGDVVCAARGIFAVAPSVRTLIDIGAQSSRVIWLDDSGRVANFASNEKCATGSGRFLQVIANVLRVKLEEVGSLSLRSEHPITFTTGCAVFGESEAITRVSEGVAKEDILAGVHRSLAEKIASLVRTRGLQGDWAVCGGGALDVGLLKRLEEELGTALVVPPRPQTICALGAAVQARRLEQSEEEGASVERRRGSAQQAPSVPPRTGAGRSPPTRVGGSGAGAPTAKTREV